MKNESVELIHWSDRLSCGIKIIDDQHKELIALVNDLFNHVAGDEKQKDEYILKVIRGVVKYAKTHFATEEKIILEAKIPGYTSHKKAHGRFIVNILDYVYNYKTGKKINLYTFTKFLKDWVLSHIAITDKQYFLQIKLQNG